MSRSDTIRSLRAHLDAATAMRAAARADADGGAQRAAVRRWQSERLSRTYADMLADSRHRAAATFFLTDLYSTADHSARDDEMRRALPKLARMLPEPALEALGLALELDALSESLDGALAGALFRGAAPGPVDEPAYAAAYRAVGRRADRERQIMLVDAVGATLDRIAHSTLLATAVQMMQTPARLAGLGELQGFLERGLAAFQSMNGAGDFLARVRARETAILERLFDAVPRPFMIDVQS